MVIDDNWRIDKDGSTVALVFSEPRVRIKKSDGSKERYIFEDKWYYPSLPLALKSYVNRSLNKSKDISEIFNQLININRKIDKLCNTK